MAYAEAVVLLNCGFVVYRRRIIVGIYFVYHVLQTVEGGIDAG